MMITYLIRQLILLIIMLFLLSIVSFSLYYFTNKPITYHLLLGDWWQWFQALIQGDFGVSRITHQPIAPQLHQFFPATLELSITAFFMALIIGVSIGITTGAMNHQWPAKMTNMMVQVGMSLPVFCSGLMFSLIFSLILQWLPISGRYNLLFDIKPITGFALIDAWLDLSQWRYDMIKSVLIHMILPVCTLTVIPAAEIIHLMYDNTIEVMAKPFIKVAATRGISVTKIIYRYVLHNVFPATIPYLGLQFSSILASTMIVETIFNWPGVGKWLINAMHVQDFNIISAVVMVSGSLIIIINTLANIVSVLFNPMKQREWYAEQ